MSNQVERIANDRNGSQAEVHDTPKPTVSAAGFGGEAEVQVANIDHFPHVLY
jgi:hypothetical protein